jgi:deoxyhypusine synthase
VFTTVLLTENPLTEHDVLRLVALHGDEPVRFHIVIAADADISGFDEAVDDIARTHFRDALHEEDEGKPEAQLLAEAHARLTASVAALRAAGAAEVDGSVVPHKPVDATVQLAGQLDADEIVVLTEPHLVSDMMRRDWATRLRHKVHLPVLHVISGTDEVYT